MAFVITPRFTPVYQVSRCHPLNSCGRTSQPTHAYRISRPQPRHPQYSSFNHFFGQVDELLSEIDHEAQRLAQLKVQREAHRERQQRKRALRAEFSVNQDQQGWLINGDIQGFDQENISIEVTDEHTLKITGNTKWQAEKAQSDAQDDENNAIPNVENDVTEQIDNPDSVNLPTKPAVDSTTFDSNSETESHKSYQPTVEDDFEDLTAETSSLLSVASVPSTASNYTESSATAVVEPPESKGKGKAVFSDTVPVSKVTQNDRESEREQERVHGSFERTFQFPERIDVGRVSAQFLEHVLSITVPKNQASRTRKIAIL
ncbi:HSP20-like chaperone [Pyrenochaeta sp. DS3sAY3a]|nr:HSP20-like chaperone [Pyrenochaeta sp. DS3sAY3a]